ncbi:hypothetical protein [Burkholderia lata]|uniref:Uncharacterized protein n=1 Tax=Burkholderia lata (strain ATCC 17760 / DSM 23089 / LMG 22485 / NCIMB 9086 / R18194 / 383) TaxID=482957 RepID=A0A6P2TKD5_BURL3|nr:hypothetical protein [Burkholderia lata]VWC60972.1 hypothetical protein BLA18109_01568 [Burkholderia lata]
MVAIVTGQGLGPQSSSSTALGSRGVLGNAAFGQAGEQVYVNAANGNPMLKDRDQLPLGQGINGSVYRAYRGNLDFRGVLRLERSRLHAGLRPAPTKYWFKIKWLLSGCHADGFEAYRQTNR